MEGSNVLGWYYSGNNPMTDAPSSVMTVSNSDVFYVSPDVFTGKTGAWYINPGTPDAKVAFYVQKASLSLSLFHNETGKDISNKIAIENNNIAFRLNSNLDALFSRNSSGSTAGVDCYVETPDGAILTELIREGNSGDETTQLTGIQPKKTLFYLPYGNRETVWTINPDYYKEGTYKFYAICNVNSMKDNLGTRTGVTKSEIVTLFIKKETLTITADKETLVRNNDFTVTMEGNPKTDYIVWISGTNSYSNKSNCPPKFLPNQDNVIFLKQSELNAMYYETYKSVAQDVTYAANGVDNEWAVKAQTGNDGKITIGLTTDEDTMVAVYKIRAEKVATWPNQLDENLYDKVYVRIDDGKITLAASGDGSYFLGDEVTLSGTNTDTNEIYLFITGPNLPENGGVLTNPQQAINTISTENYTKETVKTDDTWEYKWDTSGLSLETGSYTIYAVSQMRNKSGLADVEYDTIDITIFGSTDESLLALKPGWNFISTPKRLDSFGGNNTAGKLFGDVDSGGHSALMYNGTNGGWDTVKADTVIEPLDALWIYSNSTGNKDIYLTYDSNPLQVPPSKYLSAGWNTLGYSSTEPATARDTLIDVSGKWTKAIGWNATIQNFEYTIINGGSGIYSDSRPMLPGKGYWIWMKEEGTIASLAINSEEV
jgi:hypothetical protein